MAHGYGMISRKIPAVMVHVSVGTANMVCAGDERGPRERRHAADRRPHAADRGRHASASRDGYIHWAQEMYDQAGMLREFVKWDYELRNGEQLETVVDRALSIAASEPRGPVYLSLPREVLAERATARLRLAARLRHRPRPGTRRRQRWRGGPELLAAAKRPLIITCNAGREPGAFAALLGISPSVLRFPSSQHKPRYLSLPSSHPMHLGYDPTRIVGEADVILALEMRRALDPGARCAAARVQGHPMRLRSASSHIPIRGFASDIGITGGTTACLHGAAQALKAGQGGSLRQRRAAKWPSSSDALPSDWASVRGEGGAAVAICTRPGSATASIEAKDERCDRRQRVHVAARALRLRACRTAISARARPRDLGGARARRSGRSSLHRAER